MPGEEPGRPVAMEEERTLIATVASRPLLEVDCDALILAIHPQDISESEKRVDALLGEAISRRREAGTLRTDRGEMTSFYLSSDEGPDRIALVGLGKRAPDGLQLRRTYAAAVRTLIGEGVKTLAVDLALPGVDIPTEVPLTEGCLLGGYSFSGYKKSEDAPKVLGEVIVGFLEDSEPDPALAERVKRSETLAVATLAARDLGNEPGNVLTPRVFAERAEEMAREKGMDCVVFDEDRLEEMGLGLLLGVARGSEEPARVIQLTLEAGESGGEDVPTLVLVGKGLTFDSGGISIKGSIGMHEMKMDMGGAAAVYGAMMALADFRPRGLRVVALIGAVENMPDGRATKPGDVLRACDGTSVEVINTDAEGRLVVGDLVAYAVKTFDPSWIVDAATLTGAVMVALGDQAAGVVTSDPELFRTLERAGDAAGERFWQLPSYEEYEKELKSEVADLKNSGGRNAGAITGALFIGSFRGDRPWAHLDIAGVAWTDKAKGMDPVGATGFGVRSLAALPALLVESKE